jgi:hypothetical protein
MIALLAEALGPQVALSAVAIGMLVLTAVMWSVRPLRELD